jgi:peroxiredoxin
MNDTTGGTNVVIDRRIILGLVASLFAFATLASADHHEKAEKTEAHSVAEVGKIAPDFTLADSKGKKHSLSDFEGKYVILEWVNYDCPFVKKHYNSKNMQSLQDMAAEKEVVWLSICSSAAGKQGYFEGDELNERIEKEGSKATAYLVDEDGQVGMTYEAKTTPHMYVIDPEGVLIYAGAIDDRPSTKVADVEGANNYVVSALTASMAGEDLDTDWTKSYGCSVKYGSK